MLNRLCTVASVSLILTACANSAPHSFGEKLAARSDKTNALSKQWDEGQSNVKKGEKLIEKGKKNQQEGLILVETGKKQMADAEAAYRNITTSPIPTPP
jgi:hypothetical protein